MVKKTFLISILLMVIGNQSIVVGMGDPAMPYVPPARSETAASQTPMQQTLQGNHEIALWSFTDELKNILSDYYRKARQGSVTIDYTLTPTEQFPSRLDRAFESGRGVPDVFSLESSFVRKYVESGFLLDITDIYEANKHKLLAYPVEVGTYNGRVYALSWQTCPGAMFYRRSLAVKYLGSDDPAFVQRYFANIEKFVETARRINKRSNGSCVVIASSGDLFMPFLGARQTPWVADGKLVIDPVMERYMDVCKKAYDNRWEGRAGQWSESWFAGMRGEQRDENGKKLETFAYFLPTWGLHYVLKPNTPSTSGDWAMIPGFAPYYWGGTWIGAYKNTANIEAAKDFIGYLAADDAFHEAWATNSGEFVGNMAAADRVKNSFSDPFLGDQNHYAAFAEIAQRVDGTLAQATDAAIESLFEDAVGAFVSGEMTKAQALENFRRQAEGVLGR